MTFTIVENVRGFFVTRPPLVVFLICLGSFAIALITFAYIVKVKDMPNPDVTEDWNTFLEPLSKLVYCVVSEPGAAISNASQEAPAPTHLKDSLKQISDQILKKEGGSQGVSTVVPPTTTISTRSAVVTANISVLLDLELMATTNLQHVSTRHNSSFITATLKGQQLGLEGNRAHLEANLTIALPPLVNHSHHCQHGQCFKLRACVTMTAVPKFFPQTLQHPEVDTCMREVDLSGENHFHLEQTPSYINCINASILTLKHQYDPSLTVMLTMQDRSVINLHLMHTSYFLFVMMVTLFCYAIVKGRASKAKVVYTQCASDTQAASQS